MRSRRKEWKGGRHSSTLERGNGRSQARAQRGRHCLMRRGGTVSSVSAHGFEAAVQQCSGGRRCRGCRRCSSRQRDGGWRSRRSGGKGDALKIGTSRCCFVRSRQPIIPRSASHGAGRFQPAQLLRCLLLSASSLFCHISCAADRRVFVCSLASPQWSSCLSLSRQWPSKCRACSLFCGRCHCAPRLVSTAP